MIQLFHCHKWNSFFYSFIQFIIKHTSYAGVIEILQSTSYLHLIKMSIKIVIKYNILQSFLYITSL